MTAASGDPSPSKSPVTFDRSHAGPISFAMTAFGGTLGSGDDGGGGAMDLDPL